MTNTSPLIKDMDDAGVWDAYWSARNANANSADLARSVSTRHGRQVAARGVGRNLRTIDICAAVARRRGINLLGPRPE